MKKTIFTATNIIRQITKSAKYPVVTRLNNCRNQVSDLNNEISILKTELDNKNKENEILAKKIKILNAKLESIYNSKSLL